MPPVSFARRVAWHCWRAPPPGTPRQHSVSVLKEFLIPAHFCMACIHFLSQLCSSNLHQASWKCRLDWGSVTLSTPGVLPLSQVRSELLRLPPRMAYGRRRPPRLHLYLSPRPKIRHSEAPAGAAGRVERFVWRIPQRTASWKSKTSSGRGASSEFMPIQSTSSCPRVATSLPPANTATGRGLTSVKNRI